MQIEKTVFGGIMEKEKKVKKFLLSIPFGFFWFIICYALDSLLGIAMLFCYIHPYEMLIVIGYFMVMILYYFHKATSGTWVGYLECGFLLICCIIGSWCGHVILTGIDNRRINLLIWGCRLMPLCLVAMLVSSFVYKRDKKKKHTFAKAHKSICYPLYYHCSNDIGKRVQMEIIFYVYCDSSYYYIKRLLNECRGKLWS